MPELRHRTVAITGASSGIGMAAALAFAREGANVALIARDKSALAAVAERCRRRGVRAIAIAADVADARAMADAARQAARITGQLDVWINNAGVGAIGDFVQTPPKAHARTIETNLIGAMNGAHAALPYFRKQRGGGVLINTNSFGGWVPAPFAAAYSASKFGLRGFSEALRAELGDQPRIHICDVFPSFIDTPGIQHGANETGRRLKPAPPAIGPDRVASVMVSLARAPRDAVAVGAVAHVAPIGYALMPGVARWAMRRFLQTYLRRARRTRRHSGGLFRPAGPRAVTRGGGRPERPEPGWTAGGALAAAAAGLAGIALARLASGRDSG